MITNIVVSWSLGATPNKSLALRAFYSQSSRMALLYPAPLRPGRGLPFANPRGHRLPITAHPSRAGNCFRRIAVRSRLYRLYLETYRFSLPLPPRFPSSTAASRTALPPWHFQHFPFVSPWNNQLAPPNAPFRTLSQTTEITEIPTNLIDLSVPRFAKNFLRAILHSPRSTFPARALKSIPIPEQNRT